jgi:hypothetical protein
MAPRAHIVERQADVLSNTLGSTLALAGGGRVRGAKHFRNGLPVEDVVWQHVTGEPTSADVAGPYTLEERLRMDDASLRRVQSAFRAGLESPQAVRDVQVAL